MVDRYILYTLPCLVVPVDSITIAAAKQEEAEQHVGQVSQETVPDHHSWDDLEPSLVTLVQCLLLDLSPLDGLPVIVNQSMCVACNIPNQHQKSVKGPNPGVFTIQISSLCRLGLPGRRLKPLLHTSASALDTAYEFVSNLSDKPHTNVHLLPITPHVPAQGVGSCATTRLGWSCSG